MTAIANEKSLKRPRIKSLNGLKVIALVLIVWAHGGGAIKFNIASRGVDFFFIAAGFFAFYSAIGKQISCSLKGTVSYVAKKAIPVIPLYLLGFIYFLLLSRPTLGTALTNFFMLQAWSPNSEIYFSLNGPSWYITVWLFCSLMFPFVKKLIDWAKRPTLLAAAFVALRVAMEVVLICTDAIRFDMHVFPLVRLTDFICGMFVAYFFARYREKLTVKFWAASIAEILILAVLIVGDIYFSFKGKTSTLVLLNYLAVFIFAFDNGMISKVLSLKIFDWLYGFQLEVYLLHSVCLSFTYSTAGRIFPIIKENAPIKIAVAIAGLLVFSVIYQKFIKKHAQALVSAVFKVFGI